MMEIPEKIKEILEKLQSAKFDAYLVGGCVRDLVLSEAEGLPFKRKIKDWDITTNATPEQIQKVFPDSFYENSFGTVSVKNETEEESLKVVEITPYRLEGKYSDKRHPDEVKFAKKLEDDLSRRDFTVNALAISGIRCPTPTPKGVGAPTLLKANVGEYQFVDLVGGQDDLKNKIIRTVGDGEKRFSEDALRLMRAVRFATELNFQIEEKTQKAIKKMAHNLEFVSGERIRDEFSKIIASNDAAFGVWLLNDLDLLKYVLPELCEGIGVVGVTKYKKSHIKYDELSVFDHNLKTLEYAAKNNFNFETRLAALLHDLGKPKTKQGEGLGASFKNHEQVGAKMALRALERLHFSKKVIEKSVLLVRWHFFFYNADEVSEAGVRRLIARVGAENINDLLSLREADRSGSGLPKISPYRLQHLRYMIDRVSRDAIHPKMLKINGNDLMKMLKIDSGPKIGWILNSLLDEVLDDPKKNDEKNLQNKAKKLNDLSEDKLKKLYLESIQKQEEIENEIDENLKRKYNV